MKVSELVCLLIDLPQNADIEFSAWYEGKPDAIGEILAINRLYDNETDCKLKQNPAQHLVILECESK